MKKLIQILTITLALVSLSACSNQWREADPGISDAQLFEYLNEFSAGGSISVLGNNTTTTEFTNLFQETFSNVYYSEAPGALGPVYSVMALADFSIFDASLAGSSPYDLQMARLFLVENGADYMMGVQFQFIDEANPRKYILAAESASFKDDSFEAIFTVNGGKMLARTYDLQDNFFALAGVIQLKLYRLSDTGEETFIGQFSTMVGFGVE